MIRIIPIKWLPFFPEPILFEHVLFGKLASETDGPTSFIWDECHFHSYFSRLPQGMHHPHMEAMPSSDQWNELWKICDEIDIWSWPESLGDKDHNHPERWFTRLTLGSRSTLTRGCLGGTPPDFRAKLIRFHRAVQVLAGWHDTASA
jgi:hypothetical protein